MSEAEARVNAVEAMMKENSRGDLDSLSSIKEERTRYYVDKLPVHPNPINPFSTHNNYTSDTSEIEELSNIFIKKEMLLARLNKFNDKSEFYNVWRMTFQCYKKVEIRCR